MGFKSVINKKRYGEKVEIPSLTDKKTKEVFYIYPRKFSIPEMDEIRLMESKLVDKNELAKLSKYQAKIQKEKGDAKDFELDIDSIPDEIVASMVSQQYAEVAKLTRYQIKYGIYKHNFTEDCTESTEMDDELLDFIMSIPEVANSILNVITEFNRPLQEGK